MLWSLTMMNKLVYLQPKCIQFKRKHYYSNLNTSNIDLKDLYFKNQLAWNLLLSDLITVPLSISLTKCMQ